MRIGFGEFVAMVAALMALNALAIDVMLPSLQQIGSALAVDDENERQAVLSAYLLAFGIGQLLVGTLSDRFGRKPVLLGGLALYILAAAVCAAAPSFEALLAARSLQGLASAAPRVVVTAVVRDCYTGRRMASVMSLAMTAFIAVPVLAHQSDSWSCCLGRGERSSACSRSTVSPWRSGPGCACPRPCRRKGAEQPNLPRFWPPCARLLRTGRPWATQSRAARCSGQILVSLSRPSRSSPKSSTSASTFLSASQRSR